MMLQMGNKALTVNWSGYAPNHIPAFFWLPMLELCLVAATMVLVLISTVGSASYAYRIIMDPFAMVFNGLQY